MQTDGKLIPFPIERVYEATLDKVVTLFQGEEYEALLLQAEYLIERQLDWSIVRIYMASLIQLERYEQLFIFLRKLLQEAELNEEQRQECKQLLRLQEESQLLGSGEFQFEGEGIVGEVQEQEGLTQRFSEDEAFRQHVLAQLQSTSGTKRLQALELCQYAPYDEEMKEILLANLAESEEEPLAKAFILQLFRRWGMEGTYRVVTADGSVEIPLQRVPRDERDLDADQYQVLQQAIQLMEAEAPHLLLAVRPTWIMFLIFSLPQEWQFRPAEVWAQTLVAYCQYLHGLEQFADPHAFHADAELLYLMERTMQHPFLASVSQD